MVTRPGLSADKKALLERRLRGVEPESLKERVIPRRREQEWAPLSFSQRQMWVIDQMNPGNPAYNLPVGYRLKGSLDLTALETSFNEIIKRHEVLRTSFAVRDGEPIQLIHSECKMEIDVIGLEELSVEERETRLQALASTESAKSFDLSRLPLIRVSLFRLGQGEHVLIINLHHIVTDGMSVGLLLDELDAFYRIFTDGGRLRPADLAVQYADFAAWQRQTIANEATYARQIEFWRSKLGRALPVLDLPIDRPRPTLQSFKGSNVHFKIPTALAGELKSLGASEQCTFFMTLLAGFGVLLQRYCSADEIFIGTPVSTRAPHEVEPLIGNFLNVIALRFELSGDSTFIELLRRSREITLDAFSNSDVPFEEMIRHLKFERHAGRNSIFQVLLQVLSTTAPKIGDLEVSNFHFDLKIAQCDLSLHLYEEVGDFVGRFEYCTDLFETSTVERLSSNFEQLLNAIVRNPRERISNIPMIAAAEGNQICREWNGTTIAFPRTVLVHQLFESRVARTPERTALRFGAAMLSYGELEDAANRLAQVLRSRGVGRGQRVGLCVERGVDVLAAVLGILKAGAAYVPLDPSFPAERLRFMAEDAQLTLLVSTSALVAPFALPRERQLLLDVDAETIDVAPATRLPVEGHAAQPEDPAYVIYTSGSTGKPKGVVVPHRAVVNFLASMAREPGLTADDVLVAVTTLSFDIAVLELQLPLTVGATIVMASRDEALDGHSLRALLEQSRATVMQATPVTWRLLLEAGWEGGKNFKALVGGEALPQDLADQLLGRGVELWNMYGPTETTVWSTCVRITDPSRGITIGKPIANTTVYVLDAQQNLCPIGVPGELCIGGEGVTLGYWNRPELTAERFIPDPFSSVPGATLYRTGDRARWRNDGMLQHLGRFDFQVKVRGFRIELGEIEVAIARHPAVREATVIVREDIPGEQRLVAYVVAANPPGNLADQLRKLLRTLMPEYMVPAHFVMLEAMPLTQNNKLDRLALPAPDLAQPAQRTGIVEPRTGTENVLAGIWQEVLGLARVGVDENFFELGGHSLAAMQVVSRVQQAFSVELPRRHLFITPTISGLAECIDGTAQAQEARAPVPPLRAEPNQEPAELSFAQQRLWLLDRMEMASTAYVIPRALRIQGTLQTDAFQNALGYIVARHESLRTIFASEEQGPVQTVCKEGLRYLTVLDMSDTAETLEAAIEDEMHRGFDLAAGPLFRALLFRLGPDEQMLLLLQHHIISDAWSVDVMLSELWHYYLDQLSDCVSEPTPLPVQYRDFARWQRERLRGQELARQREFWSSHLFGAPQVLDLPADRPRPSIESHRGATYSFTIPREVSDRLGELSRREGASLFMALMTAFYILLWRYTAQEDLLVGTAVTHRDCKDLEGLIGLFVNSLVLRGDLSGNPTVQELLGRVRERSLDAFAHQELPFERLVDELRVERDLSRNPLFQVMLILQNAPQRFFEVPGLRITPFEVDRGASMVDLTLYVQEAPDGLKCTFEYATDLFDRSTIVRMATHWHRLLDAMSTTPECSLADLPLLTEFDRHQLQVEWNNTNRDYPRTVLVHQLFESRVARTPERTALRFGAAMLSYGELEDAANRLAQVLRSRGVGRGQRVGLCVERGVDVLAAVLGILKAGAAYVPLDPSFPAERLRFMAEDAQLTLLVSTSALVAPFALPRERQLLLDVDAETIDVAPATRLPVEGHAAQPEDPAYVIYTSGSTGKPKGVVVPHRAVVNFLASMAREPGLTADDVLVAVTTLSFDIAVLELQLPLTVGATIVMASRDEALDGHSLRALLEQSRATVMQATPVTWRLLLEAGWEGGKNFKALVGGEALPQDLADQLLGRGVELWNMYGPTETTVWSTCVRITDPSRGITIGKPIANTTVYVLDAQQNLCPIGVPGELCIGGEGVTLGYWNRPELTAERFIPDPFSSVPGATLYRTGDRARWRNDGMLQHLGRFDFQVKVRGFRIELGEIEVALAEHPDVRQAAVHVWTANTGDERIVACCVPATGQTLAPINLRRHLRALLPDYMVPQYFLPVDAIPLTPTGKVDRRKLPIPVVTDGRIGREEAPSGSSETAIADIWAKLIHPERPISRLDKFFEIGGHSLLGVQAITQIEDALGVKLEFRVLFQDCLAEIAMRCPDSVEVTIPSPQGT